MRSALAEFSSVVNAVDCAVRIQRDLAERNATLPGSRRMLFRIGVNLGDVLVDGDDLFGEGVNIAARLQALAEPGGVLVSGPVFEQVRNKLSLGFDYLGAQAVKNISEALPVYRVVLGAESPRPGVERAGGQPAADAAPAPGAPQAAGGHCRHPDRHAVRHQHDDVARLSLVHVADARHPRRRRAALGLGRVPVSGAAGWPARCGSAFPVANPWSCPTPTTPAR